MLCKGLRTWSRRTAAVAAAVSLIALATPETINAEFRNQDGTQKPPTISPYAYGEFGPRPEPDSFPDVGQYIYGEAGDPVFGGRVRRVTREYPNPSKSDIYAKNGFWSSDGKLMYHLDTLERNTIINSSVGSPANATLEVPGDVDYSGFDGSFAPVEPTAGRYTWYYFSGSKLMKYSISIVDGRPVLAPGVAPNPVMVKDFKDFGARTLAPLGGSVDWIDNSGNLMVLNLGGKVRVWNKEFDQVYSGSVGASAADWIGISPDGKYVVTSTDKGFYSYAVVTDAATRTGTLSTKGILFWTLCGGHGDLVTASNLRTYMVTFDCYGSTVDSTMQPAIYAVDVAPPSSVVGRTEGGRSAQRQANKKLFEPAWGDDGHFSGVSRGIMQDWAFVSVESYPQPVPPYDEGDIFGRPVGDWWDRAYMQEIVMVNVMTCQVVRVAHHRSRSINNSYYYQPRVSANWDGTSAAWLSNFGVSVVTPAGDVYADVYAVDVDSTEMPPPPATSCR
jgi:hypothetical protein